MKKLNLNIKDIRNWSVEKISHTVLYAITALTALIFILFYFVGYDTPAIWDERYNDPILTDLVIVLMILLLVVAIALVIYSKVHSLRTNHAPAIVNGIKGKRVTVIITAGVLALMLLSYLAIPAGKLIINGEEYTDTVWLRMANMFVISSVVLIIAGITAIAYGVLSNMREKKRNTIKLTDSMIHDDLNQKKLTEKSR